MSWPGWENYTGPCDGQCGQAAERPAKPKAHKYHAQPTEVDGHLFPSKREADRYRELLALQAAGEICGLRTQVRFPLSANGIEIGCYVADFTYGKGGTLVIEDAKGMKTPLYRWKRRHFEAQYSIPISEV